MDVIPQRILQTLFSGLERDVKISRNSGISPAMRAEFGRTASRAELGCSFAGANVIVVSARVLRFVVVVDLSASFQVRLAQLEVDCRALSRGDLNASNQSGPVE